MLNSNESPSFHAEQSIQEPPTYLKLDHKPIHASFVCEISSRKPNDQNYLHSAFTNLAYLQCKVNSAISGQSQGAWFPKSFDPRLSPSMCSLWIFQSFSCHKACVGPLSSLTSHLPSWNSWELTSFETTVLNQMTLKLNKSQVN